MVRALHRSIFAALGLAGLLAGCSPGPVIDRLPGDLGLPGGAPARPATSYQYPAVHDMPPARSTAPMSDEEQMTLEKDLQAARDRQEAAEAAEAEAAAQEALGESGQKAAPPAKNKAATVKKKKPQALDPIPPAGAKTSGAKTNP